MVPAFMRKVVLYGDTYLSPGCSYNLKAECAQSYNLKVKAECTLAKRPTKRAAEPPPPPAALKNKTKKKLMGTVLHPSLHRRCQYVASCILFLCASLFKDLGSNGRHKEHGTHHNANASDFNHCSF